MRMRFVLISLWVLGVMTLSSAAFAQSLDEDPTVNGVDPTGSLADGYDVILVAGQSNMAGRAAKVAGDPDGAIDPRVFMWNPASGTIGAAYDPLIHQEPTAASTAGLALTMAKAYIKTIPSNRKVLLVGAAFGGTSFNEDVTAPTSLWDFTTKTFNYQAPNLHHRWMATLDPAVGGDLYRGAVRRANDAMAKAGPTARFVGILWHQGESDSVNGGAPTYATNLQNLITALRSNITGASSRTPVVVGEFNPCLLAACPARTGTQPTVEAFNQILNYFHALRSTTPYTAWVSSAGLTWNSDGTHFDLPAIRELGRRYAAKLQEAQFNMPQPEVELRMYGTKYFNVGTSIELSPLSARINGNATPAGTVTTVTTTERGNVLKVQAQAGSLETPVNGTLFNGSYTKMAWVNLATLGYSNNLVSALNPTQRHHLSMPGGRLAAGHGGTTTVTLVQAPNIVTTNTWTHVAVVYNASAKTMTLYVNGTAVSSASQVAAAPAASGTLALQFSRYGQNATSYGLDGSMGDARVYRAALTSSQVHAVYRFGAAYRSGY